MILRKVPQKIYRHVKERAFSSLGKGEKVGPKLRVREKLTLQFIALRFGPDLVDLIGLDRKRSQSYTEDSERKDRTQMA